MNESISTGEKSVTPLVAPSKSAGKALNSAAVFWFVVVIIGQWIFTFYILMVYGGSAIKGNFETWNELLPTGIAKGDPMGNGALIAHVFFAAVINAGGPLQLIPQIRNRFPVFHRWNGRLFVFAAMVAGLGGVYMTFTRGNVGGAVLSAGNVLSAFLMVLFGILVIRYARMRKLDIHRKWALRLFMVVSTTWFFRLGIILWYALTGGAGIDGETFTGPFISFWAFGQYMLPLAILELYLFAKDRGSTPVQYVAATTLILATLAMAAGLFFTTAGFWLPYIMKY